MNDNNQLIESVEKKLTGDKVSSKRRILVKGAAGAVPTILTLRSGAAFALNSAEMCVGPDNTKAEVAAVTGNLDIIATTTDTWVREAVFCRTLTEIANTSNVFKVYNTDPSTIFNWRPERYVDNTDPTYIDDTAGTAMVLAVTGDVNVPTHSYIETLTCYILAIIDSTGTKTTLLGTEGLGATDYPYITNSCWVSATPTP